VALKLTGARLNFIQLDQDYNIGGTLWTHKYKFVFHKGRGKITFSRRSLLLGLCWLGDDKHLWCLLYVLYIPMPMQVRYCPLSVCSASEGHNLTYSVPECCHFLTCHKIQTAYLVYRF
jgi:hypothetical protein